VPSPRYPDDYAGLREGYVKPADVAWYVSHYHTADGLNEPYRYSYLFA
jgi:alpha-mannosidase